MTLEMLLWFSVSTAKPIADADKSVEVCRVLLATQDLQLEGWLIIYRISRFHDFRAHTVLKQSLCVVNQKKEITPTLCSIMQIINQPKGVYHKGEYKFGSKY